MREVMESIRNAAAADTFRQMNTEESSYALLQRSRAMPDAMLDLVARQNGVPEEQFPILQAMVRGEDNVFIEEMKEVGVLLQAGDLILMTGTAVSSQRLARAQKIAYAPGRSSHVAVVHADFVCIDAMPKVGVSNRIVSEVLLDAQPGWRVIRCAKVQPEHLDALTRACVFYLAQPYKILPSSKAMKNCSYCSELARKVYSHCGITGIGIPNAPLIMPVHFDRLADEHKQWIDVTDTVRPAIEFCIKYSGLVKIFAKLLIDGLKLNRSRFKERTDSIAGIRKASKAGKIPREAALKMIKEIRDIENDLNHTFWDVSRSD